MYKNIIFTQLMTMFLLFQSGPASGNAVDDIDNFAKQMGSCFGTLMLYQSVAQAENQGARDKIVDKRIKQMGLLSAYLVTIQSEGTSPSDAMLKVNVWIEDQLDTHRAIIKLQGQEVAMTELKTQIQKCSELVPTLEAMSPLMYEDPVFVKYINQLP